MTANRMIELMDRTPFEPLEIHLSDGERIHVEQPLPNCHAAEWANMHHLHG